MVNRNTLTLLVRLLRECLEENYTAEELRSKIRDALRLLAAIKN
jgi:hypothetical protein